MTYPLRYYTNPLQAFGSLLLQAAEHHDGHGYVLDLLDKTEAEQSPLKRRYVVEYGHSDSMESLKPPRDTLPCWPCEFGLSSQLSVGDEDMAIT
jgi:hypothetical protein